MARSFKQKMQLKKKGREADRAAHAPGGPLAGQRCKSITANHNLSAFPAFNLTDTTSAREEEQPGQPGAGYRDCSWGE